jgi:hypothetical protein
MSNLGEVALVEDIVAGMDISNDLSLDLNDTDQSKKKKVNRPFFLFSTIHVHNIMDICSYLHRSTAMR